MIKHDNNIDALFRNEAAQYRHAPSDKVWAAIDSKLHKKKKRLVFSLIPLLKIAAIVVLVTFSAIYLYIHEAPTAHLTELQRVDNVQERFSIAKSQSIYNMYLSLGEEPKYLR